jgi:hypothetical protein
MHPLSSEAKADLSRPRPTCNEREHMDSREGEGGAGGGMYGRRVVQTAIVFHAQLWPFTITRERSII